MRAARAASRAAPVRDTVPASAGSRRRGGRRGSTRCRQMNHLAVGSGAVHVLVGPSEPHHRSRGGIARRIRRRYQHRVPPPTTSSSMPMSLLMVLLVEVRETRCIACRCCTAPPRCRSVGGCRRGCAAPSWSGSGSTGMLAISAAGTVETSVLTIRRFAHERSPSWMLSSSSRCLASSSRQCSPWLWRSSVTSMLWSVAIRRWRSGSTSKWAMIARVQSHRAWRLSCRRIWSRHCLRGFER